MDIIVASITFLLLVIILLFLYDTAQERTILQQNRNDMERLARQTVHQLVLNPGTPGWESQQIFNRSRISTLGASGREPWTLSFSKLKKLILINNSQYNDTKALLGLSSYDYYLEIGNTYGFSELAGFFNSSAPGSIGYSYGNDDEQSYTSQNYGILAYFQEKGMPIDNYQSDYKSLIGNLTKYQVVIFENPMVEQADLTPQETALLQNYVMNGGWYFQKGFGTMIQVYGLQTNNNAHEEGTVMMEDPMLKDVSVGDHVEVEGGLRINKQGTMLSVIDSTSGHILAGHMSYGAGQVYYYPYSIGIVESQNGTQTHNNTREILNLPWRDSSRIAIGIFPGAALNASEVVKVSRLVQVEDRNGRKPAWLDFYLWQKCKGVSCME